MKDWDVPPPTLEKNKKRPIAKHCQWPVGHVLALSYYETSDTCRAVFMGYDCIYCRNSACNGTLTLKDSGCGCPAFCCSKCYDWYEAPLSKVSLPGAERSEWFCLNCLRGLADRTATEMRALIEAAQ